MEKDLKNKGYSKEEEYFHKLNQELIEKMREKKEKEASRENETEGRIIEKN